VNAANPGACATDFLADLGLRIGRPRLGFAGGALS
jgi:hypothetical protein